MSAAVSICGETRAPHHWKVRPLGEVVTLLGGGTPSKMRGDFWDGDIPWVSPKDMKFDVIIESIDNITSAAIDGSAAKIIPAGALLVVVRSGILARTVPIALSGVEVTINQDLKALVPSPYLDARFLIYFMRSVESQLLGAVTRGATVHRLETDVLKSLAIPLPPLEEQRRIVAILDQAFAALDRARALAEANLADARDLFDNTLSEIFSLQRQGWVEAAIGDCIRFIDYRGRTPDKTTSGLRLITAKNVKKGYLQDEPREFVAEDSYSGWMTRGIPVQGDVLFTTEAPLGNVAQLDTSDKVVFAQRIIIMQADANRIDSTFLKYMLLSSPVQKRIHAKATGATALGIKASLLKTIKISFPKDIAEQRGIVEKIDMLQEKTKRLEALYVSKLIDLANLRQSLLQKAFTGQLT